MLSPCPAPSVRRWVRPPGTYLTRGTGSPVGPAVQRRRRFGYALRVGWLRLERAQKATPPPSSLPSPRHRRRGNCQSASVLSAPVQRDGAETGEGEETTGRTPVWVGGTAGMDRTRSTRARRLYTFSLVECWRVATPTGQGRDGWLAGWPIDEWAGALIFLPRRQPDFYASDWLFGVLVEARPAGADGAYVAGLQYLSFRFWQLRSHGLSFHHHQW